jgi:hypothetical protein
MDTEKKVIIGRAINGISINGLEYLLGENGKVKEFENKQEAVRFLKDNGIFDKDLGHFIYKKLEADAKTVQKPYKPSQKPVNKRTRLDIDDDRGR